MSDIKVFEDVRFGSIRIVMQGADPWFVAKDVCDCLALSNPTMALEGLADDEKMTLSNAEGHAGQQGGAQFFNIISEPGLYRLIFKSRKEEAEAFRRWVTHEVLPSIRKTGMYPTLPNFGNPAEAARAWADEYERRLAAEQEKQKVQTALAYEQSAHAATHQQLAQAATLCHSLADTLGVGCNFKSCIAQQKELVKWFYIDNPDYYGDKFYSTLGKFMSKLSRGQISGHETVYEIKQVQDAKYGTYNSYSIEAWADFFAILRAGQFNVLFSSLIKRLRNVTAE